MGHTPPSPSMGHEGLPDLGTVDGTPIKYSHNKTGPPNFILPLAISDVALFSISK
jgi:hypothetical protein